MYIDIHSHIGYSKIYPDAYTAGMLDGFSQFPPEKIRKLIAGFLRDKDCSEFVKQMDAAGIEKSVLLILDGGLGLSEPELSLDEIFRLHHDVLKAYPDRFIVFGGVDPRRGQAGFELFKKGILDYGFRGLKLYPPMGFSLSDERLIPYFDLCQQHKLPVLIHTGPSLSTLQNEFAEPATYFEVIEKYSGIDFILAHMGFRLEDPVIRKMLALKNVSLDITGFQTMPGEENIIEMLKPIFKEDVNEKILFGTDWPLFNLVRPIHYHIKLIRSAFEQVKGTVPADAFDKLMYKNAARILSR